MSLSTNLIKLRDREGWSQEQLAEKMGVSRSTVAKWEAGKGVPKMANLVVLCDIFQVTMDSIIRK